MDSSIIQLAPAEFPALLKEISDPPEKLYMQGELPPESHSFLCVVGSRHYSPYGKEVCEQLIGGLSGYPITIVSGLAIGIDAIAHRAALATDLTIIAVPGSGLDKKVLYPRANRSLAEKILENGGALLSEFNPDFEATVWSFPQRNRIMAGLSHAILVVEAAEKSGTLITARLATDYNRDVLAVPGPIFSKTSAGNHMLIRLGATPITKSEDILEALKFDTEEKRKFDIESLSIEEREVAELLSSPLSRDELIRKLNKPIHEVNSLLSAMELKGIIKEYLGEIHL